MLWLSNLAYTLLEGRESSEGIVIETNVKHGVLNTMSWTLTAYLDCSKKLP